jgi:hypothetical protein
MMILLAPEKDISTRERTLEGYLRVHFKGVSGANFHSSNVSATCRGPPPLPASERQQRFGITRRREYHRLQVDGLDVESFLPVE